MSQVVIGDILPYTQAIATLNQTVFGTNWTADVASDVVVYQTPFGDDANDATQQVPYPAGYSVAFIGSQQDVQVTLVTPAGAGDRITITRQTPADRENLYSNTNFTPSMLNSDFGILTLVDQQAQLVDQKIGPRYNYSAIIVDVVDTILPILGANQIWAKNGADTAIVAVDISAIISGGTVTQINTGTGLTGGPITNAGTISFAAIPAHTFWANITAGSAVPTTVATTYFLQSANNLSDLTNVLTARANLGLEIGVDVEAWSAALDSIAGLTTVANNLLYTTAADTYAVLAPVINRALISSNTGVPTWSDTLPQGVQTNINYLGQQNQNLDMGGFQINDMGEPTQPSDAATKNYVDLNALTGTSVYAASAASLGTVTQSGSGVGATLTNAGVQATFALDGVNPPVNSIVLIKNTATGMTAANEGIYTVTSVGSGATNWVLTRSTTYDTPTEINQTGLIIVQNGSTLAGTAWYNAVTIVTVDTTNFSYSQFGNIIFPVSLSNGGTNANLVASAGSVVYSTATAMAFSAVGAAGQLFQSTGTTAPGWTTATYPATSGVLGNVLTSDGTNWISSAPAAASTTVITNDTTTNASMFPVWVTANTGSLPLKVSSTKMSFNPSTGTLTLAGALSGATGLTSSTGLNMFAFNYTASAVNYMKFYNNATGASPLLEMVGSDSSVGLSIAPKNSYLAIFDSTSTVSGKIRLYNAAGTQYTGLTVPTAAAASVDFQLPSAFPAVANSPLVSNTSGLLSFLTLPALTKVVFQAFGASGTYTPTSGMKYCIIECQASGGGGGGAANQAVGGAPGGGGGAGAYARKTTDAATIGASQTVTVGAAGTGGAAGNNNGTAGNDVSVGSICVAKGGAAGGGAATANRGAGGAGGDGTAGTGDFSTYGNGGSDGTNSISNSQVPQCGQGGASYFGGQAIGQSPSSGSVTGNAGVNGAGGNGGSSFANGGTAAGGNGGIGFVLITEFVCI